MINTWRVKTGFLYGDGIDRQILVNAFLAALIGILILCPSSTRAKEYTQIIISKSSKKTPVAVTDFKTFNGHATEIRDGKRAHQILSDALNFTGYLKTMNPMAFLSNPAETGIQLGQINFRDWTGIGAEFLITGGIYEQGGKVKLELRLIDTFNKKMLAGTI